jgi:AraC-like DNA-binding protein
MTALNDVAVLRICSDDIPERDRFDYIREVYGRVIIKHDIEPRRNGPFHWRCSLRAVPGLGLAANAFSPVHTRRRSADIDGDDLVLNITLTGGRVLRQMGREAVVTADAAVLSNGAEAGTCDVYRDSRCISIRVPRGTLAPMVADVDAALVRTIPAGTVPLALLVHYAELLLTTDALEDPSLRTAAVAHVHDLVALVVGATRDTAALARDRGLRAARLNAVKADIAAHLGSGRLSLASVARRQGISTSYVRKLFESEGTSFTDFVLSRRLAEVHRALRDPRSADRAVSDIAYAAGFGDLSYFNRAFRRRFGDTPSAVRANEAGLSAGSG